jgi:hypothetical protein
VNKIRTVLGTILLFKDLPVWIRKVFSISSLNRLDLFLFKIFKNFFLRRCNDTFALIYFIVLTLNGMGYLMVEELPFDWGSWQPALESLLEALPEVSGHEAVDDRVNAAENHGDQMFRISKETSSRFCRGHEAVDDKVNNS